MLQPKSRQPQAISTLVSEKMSAPTPAVQPHWKAEVKLMSLKLDVGKHGEHDDPDDQVSKDKELKNKSVKDKRPGLKKDDLRDHMSE